MRIAIASHTPIYPAFACSRKGAPGQVKNHLRQKDIA
jgi:hypothetical protein